MGRSERCSGEKGENHSYREIYEIYQFVKQLAERKDR